MEMENHTCCFTGHRKISSTDKEMIVERVRTHIINLIQQGIIYYKTGGAMGFDTIAALTVLDLKKLYPDIKLFLILPCKNQDHGWCKEDQKTYHSIIQQCDQYTYISEEYRRGCMLERNRRLVNGSSYCICYLTGNSGGTAYTVRYANSRKLVIMNVAYEQNEP